MTIEVEDFFNRILSNKGFPVVTSLKKNTSPHQLVAENLLDFYRLVNLQKEKCDKLGRDLYFGIATIRQRYVVDQNGKHHTRVSSNCLHLKTLVLDVDTDPTGFLKGDRERLCYTSIAEAKEGVGHLCTELSLTKPYIVNSGNGLHVYWPFEQAVPAEEWYLLANKFKILCGHVDSRLIADQSRVTDRAGILRVPDTFNFKDPENKKQVKIEQFCSEVQWPSKYFSEHFDNYIDKNNIGFDPMEMLGRVAKKAKNNIVDLTLQFPDSEKIDFKEVYTKCNWYKNYMRNRHVASYDIWFPAMNLSTKMIYTIEPDGERKHLGKLVTEKIVIEGLDLAKFISKGHPGYDEALIEDKYNESIADPALSARTCADLQRRNKAWCEGCPYKEIVKSPLSIPRVSLPAKEIVVANPVVIAGSQIAVEEIALVKPPFPWDIGEDNAIYMRMKDQNGNRITSKMVYEHTIIPVKRIKDDNTSTEIIEFELRLPHDDVKRFTIPSGMFHDRSQFAKFIGDRGVLIDPDDMKLLIKYLIAYSKVIQNSAPATSNYTTFGWKDISTNNKKFVTYDHVITSTEVKHYTNTATSLRDLGSFASTQGDLKLWRDCFNVYADVSGMEVHIINLMLSFGAPLLHFIDQHGLLYNIYGKGGEGKSTSLKLATSIWGKPYESHTSIIDTTNAIYHKLGVLSNIPMAFDELTNIDPELLSNFVYSVSNGRGKDALDKNRELRQNNAHWQTFALGNSNYSLYGKLANLTSGNDAHGYRILEYQIPKPSQVINQRMLTIKNVLPENYGMAGKEYMKYIVANYAQVAQQTRRAVMDLTETDRSRERFWVAAQACIQTGGYISRDLGLHDYEPGKLIEFMRDMSPRLEVSQISGDAISKLNDYILQNLGNTIKAMDDKIVSLEIESKGVPQIAVRLEGSGQDIQRAYLPVPTVERWCRMNRVDFTWLRSELTYKRILTRTMKKRIGAGTKYYSIASQCWEIDLQHPLITGVERKTSEAPNVIKLAEAGL